MKDNLNKSRLLITSASQIEFKLGNATIKRSACDKLFAIKIDNKLRLNASVEDLCKKASRKMYAPARVIPHMTILKRRFLLNAFFR